MFIHLLCGCFNFLAVVNSVFFFLTVLVKTNFGEAKSSISGRLKTAGYITVAIRSGLAQAYIVRLTSNNLTIF